MPQPLCINALNTHPQVCRAAGVPLLINDRVDVALAIGADGVHVGQSDLPAHVVRAMIGGCGCGRWVPGCMCGCRCR